MLKIGLLTDGTDVSKYVRDIVIWAQGQDSIEISHLITHAPAPTPHQWPRPVRILSKLWHKGPFFLAAQIAWRRLVKGELRKLQRNPLYKDHAARFDITALVPHRLAVTPLVSPSGFVLRFTEADIETIRSLQLDLLLRCGSGILKGDILKAARLGVLSFHHGDNRINRGGPAGFWESYYRWPQTGFIIQQLTDELDGGNVLSRGGITTKSSYLLNQAALYEAANVYLKDMLASVSHTGVLPPAEDGPWLYDRPLFRQPNLRAIGFYGIRRIYDALVSRFYTKLLYRRGQWSLSLIKGPFERAVLWRGKEIVPPPGRCWADPFLWTHEGKTYCFIEDFVWDTNRGHITALELCGEQLVERGVALREDFHLSFPFVFPYKGKLYMCPETSKAGQIRLYECNEFPLHWTFRKALMMDVSAADTMLFEWEGRWWMYTNLGRGANHDHGFELSLFSASHPLADEWLPHPQNPIKVDSMGGRNAGMAISGGKLYRFGQMHGFDEYGQGLMVFEVTSLTPSHYEEKKIQAVMPHFREGLRGVHHMSTTGAHTVIDHKRWGRG
jgi:hypothetical protein